MKMKILVCWLASLILISCHHTDSSNYTNRSNELKCSDSIKFVNLISLTLELPNLQEYFRGQEILNQKGLVILNNRNFRGVDKLKKFNNPIQLMNEAEIKGKDIKSYIEYKEINIKNDTAYVYYRYDVQGIGIESTYFIKNCQWHLVKSNLWEN